MQCGYVWNSTFVSDSSNIMNDVCKVCIKHTHTHTHHTHTHTKHTHHTHTHHTHTYTHTYSVYIRSVQNPDFIVNYRFSIICVSTGFILPQRERSEKKKEKMRFNQEYNVFSVAEGLNKLSATVYSEHC